MDKFIRQNKFFYLIFLFSIPAAQSMEFPKSKKQKIDAIESPSLPREIWCEILNFLIHESKFSELTKNYLTTTLTCKAFNKHGTEKFKTLVKQFHIAHKDFKKTYEWKEDIKLDLDKDIDCFGFAQLPGQLGMRHRTFLMVATAHNNFELVKFLIYRGANVNYHNGNTEAAIMIAAERNLLKIAEILIENGADINRKYYGGKVVPYPLAATIKNKFIELSKLLIDKGANVNIKDFYQKTPLMYAKENGLDELVNLLIEKGAIN